MCSIQPEGCWSPIGHCFVRGIVPKIRWIKIDLPRCRPQNRSVNESKTHSTSTQTFWNTQNHVSLCLKARASVNLTYSQLVPAGPSWWQQLSHWFSRNFTSSTNWLCTMTRNARPFHKVWNYPQLYKLLLVPFGQILGISCANGVPFVNLREVRSNFQWLPAAVDHSHGAGGCDSGHRTILVHRD